MLKEMKDLTQRASSILVVDDDPTLRTALAQLFTQMGHEVRSASDGFSALCELRKKVPDLMLSDLNMPGMSGFELLSVVRRRFPQTNVIAMSGDALPPGVVADAFYQKGTTLGLLLQAAQSLVARGDSTPLRPSDALTPIWVSPSRNSASSRGYVTLSCRECLRTFPQAYETASSVTLEASCPFCCTPIRYAIVQPTEIAGEPRPLEISRNRAGSGGDERTVASSNTLG